MIPSLKAMNYKARKRPENNPVPAVAFPHTYRIIPPPAQGGAFCSAQDGVYGTPLDDSKSSRALRAHEYGHLCIHRTQPQLDDLVEKTDRDWRNAGLDNIVNAFCMESNVDVSTLFMQPTSAYPKETPKRVWALRALQAMSFKAINKHKGLTSDEITMLKQASNKLKAIGRESRTRSNSPYVTSQNVANIINTLARYFDEPPVTGRPDLEVLGGIGPDGQPGEGTGWCDMKYIERPLDKRIKRNFMARKRVAGYCGAFRNPIRALLPAFDGMAWSIKLKKQGGTILLDQSGSMNLTSEHIQKLLEDAPHATIAAYSGGRETGELRLYAKNGKYASNCSSRYGGNGVDGPALDWLGTQTGPRVWISDGLAFGASGSNHIMLRAECARICMKHDILRVNSIGEYFKLAGIKA